ncbi:MAG: hypothetical protein QOD68_1922 [Actinomycetota bacterium]|nr:hypothetical protein [Actinomycetota bacterium]
MRTRVTTLLRAAAAITLAASAMPLAAGAAAASQGGADDHKVTLCHRTNSENNPYVVITIDKAGVFKTGHDGHDEGGVYQPGDKANGVRWGDIIPAFDYYAGPQDETAGTLSHYDGLNNTAAGLDVLANGCQVPGEGEQPEPSGSLSGSCADDAFVVTGSTDEDGADDARFRLTIAGQAPVEVSGDFSKTVMADAGTVVTLEYQLGDGAWTSTGETITVTDCTPAQPTPATGAFGVACDTDGTANGVVTIGTLATHDNTGSYELRATPGVTTANVTTGQQIDVPLGAQLGLYFVPSSGPAYVVDTDTAPAACGGSTITPPPPATERGLSVVKSVSPTGPSTIGATLTYSLAVTTTGNAAQTNVTVSDVLPGYRTGTTSGTTTYVAGSATCSGSGTCTTAYDPTTHQVTWGLGTLPAGTSRSVSFRVTIDRPAASGGSIPGFDVVNVGVVGSDQVQPMTSNRVVTPVAAVEGVKMGRPGTSSGPGSVVQVLPHTGPGFRLGVTLGVAALLLLAGLGLVSLPVARRRS